MLVGGIFWYVTKVFYYASHEILLSKLHFYDIEILSAEWFRSYPTGRKRSK
jgi:hypothetical protein